MPRETTLELLERMREVHNAHYRYEDCEVIEHSNSLQCSFDYGMDDPSVRWVDFKLVGDAIVPTAASYMGYIFAGEDGLSNERLTDIPDYVTDGFGTEFIDAIMDGGALTFMRYVAIEERDVRRVTTGMTPAERIQSRVNNIAAAVTPGMTSHQIANAIEMSVEVATESAMRDELGAVEPMKQEMRIYQRFAGTRAEVAGPGAESAFRDYSALYKLAEPRGVLGTIDGADASSLSVVAKICSSETNTGEKAMHQLVEGPLPAQAINLAMDVCPEIAVDASWRYYGDLGDDQSPGARAVMGEVVRRTSASFGGGSILL